jgi:hypothetical protein
MKKGARFIPPGYVSLQLAATIAFAVDCHFATYELEEAEKNVNGIGARDVDDIAVAIELGKAELLEEFQKGMFDAPRFAALMGWPSCPDKFDSNRPWTPELVKLHVVYGYRRLEKAPAYRPSNSRLRRTSDRDLHHFDISKDRIKVLRPFELLEYGNYIPVLVNYGSVSRILPPLSQFRGCKSCPANPEGTVLSIRRALSAGRLSVDLLEEDGAQTPVPTSWWNTERGARGIWVESAVTFRTSARDVVGLPIICFEDLRQFCAPPPNFPQCNPYVAKDRGGAPQKYDVAAFEKVVGSLLEQSREWQSQAQLRAKALDHFAASLPADVDPPSDEWAKPIVRRCWTDAGARRKRSRSG